jgi:hypothetical protein
MVNVIKYPVTTPAAPTRAIKYLETVVAGKPNICSMNILEYAKLEKANRSAKVT